MISFEMKTNFCTAAPDKHDKATYKRKSESISPLCSHRKPLSALFEKRQCLKYIADENIVAKSDDFVCPTKKDILTPDHESSSIECSCSDEFTKSQLFCKTGHPLELRLESLSSIGYAEYIASILRSLLTSSKIPPSSSPCPKVHLRDWIAEIMRISKIPRQVYIIACILLLRGVSTSCFRLHRGNIHKYTLTAIMIASKYLDDITYRNKDWAIIGMKYYTATQVSLFELEFLEKMKWQVFTSRAEFFDIIDATLKHDSAIPEHPAPLKSNWKTLLKICQH
ncbi:Cyclin PHO80-like protein [Aduncisulcus paluster]|uniref:Cyclin PHO80-like protein n=1 Tax=Aduncisulcus paluster TaxID=2918883 RepID=A0ABQ5K7L7_9EUKA|nr:Cyclin PHO80-like protein [Aduncisulcus paluster]